MNISLQDNRRFVLRFDKGEEVIQGLIQFLQRQEIRACAFWGIGSAYEIELGYFNEHLKSYRKKPFYEELEIISLIGNGATLDGQFVIHAHGTFGRNDFSQIGGHVFKLVALATCEVFLIKLEGTLERKNNPDFNLQLLV